MTSVDSGSDSEIMTYSAREKRSNPSGALFGGGHPPELRIVIMEIPVRGVKY